ncbi:16S rRNA (cytidine(1402)-2'-O)-methyltransferase [Anaerococcus sp. Marseille-P3915]|uniref:16S rRNA (cytidine(1402)-2'-O)-methyltransferase n=1 Tax=Anaerococcus sp. Marseille-P3915 TaxID=2057799 RepID=UPI000D0B4ECB|nr:16S rRNA (cytidine(1402)-2'-O)-methyltransferase [Anaerococcus sp. Marseille-P3915]
MDYQIYFVPTPIGNLEDMTLRAIKTLKEVDLIACEDTRESKKLLNFYEIDKPLTSYHKFNEQAKGEELIKKASEGMTIGVISDQGMPGMSDPGEILIKKCIENNISYTILPGPSSILTALIGSGQDMSAFSFYGFIGKKTKEKKDFYEKLKNEEKTSIIFDSVHNLPKTIEDFKEIFPERRLTIARELTKKFEEYKTYTIKDINPEEITFKGEFVLILEGKKEDESVDISSFDEKIKQMIDEGRSTKEIVKIIKKESSFSKNEIYEYIINFSKDNI